MPYVSITHQTVQAYISDRSCNGFYLPHPIDSSTNACKLKFRLKDSQAFMSFINASTLLYEWSWQIRLLLLDAAATDVVATLHDYCS